MQEPWYVLFIFVLVISYWIFFKETISAKLYNLALSLASDQD